ncbi:UNKNOWN [Stylonychia lemnae]|uniref:MRPL25 domain-containing protein n=1 Tax=Stylonychia lemnae TaxID=5949 RepID=A0A078AV23_STYLE|nr:UNKNOWN [Stylonychia lemnae]|eukprot:CDW86245.1 UNKNOWN [Stylonychia lemnae]
MWLKLLSRSSIEDLIKPQLVNGSWRRPAIGGKQKADLRQYFQKAGVPWIYEKETPDVHFESTYNRKPKGSAVERNYEVRLASIRRALSTQDERLDKMRQEKIQSKPYKGYDRLMAGVLKALNQGEGEQKRGSAKQQMLAQRAVELAEKKSLGIKGTSKKQGSKSGITSKGGHFGKKEREVFEMTKGNLGYEMGGKHTSEDANEDKKTK